jgi:hypothetical protein
LGSSQKVRDQARRSAYKSKDVTGIYIAYQKQWVRLSPELYPAPPKEECTVSAAENKAIMRRMLDEVVVGGTLDL